MKVMLKTDMKDSNPREQSAKDGYSISKAIDCCWSIIPSFWPIKKLIAVNPLAGLEHLPFEEALRQAQGYFQQAELPKPMQEVNRISLKWLQVYFDQGQSSIQMPLRNQGFLVSLLDLLPYDSQLFRDKTKREWLKSLPNSPEYIISQCLSLLQIPSENHQDFLTLMLTTLPGWAAHIQYRTEWANAKDNYPHVTKDQYLAVRLILTYCIWSSAHELLVWQKNALKNSNVDAVLNQLYENEKAYQSKLTSQLKSQILFEKKSQPNAQLIFCIDVRSEPFRRKLEKQGNYETYGFAGFFGVPVSISDTVTDDSYASCPVLLKPEHIITQHPIEHEQKHRCSHQRTLTIKRIYQSLKYSFTTPFCLVELLGPLSGVWMTMKTVFPTFAQKLKSRVQAMLSPSYSTVLDINAIPIDKQISYSFNALKSMGLTRIFSPLVILCGHGSTTENNAYASSLDCGACGGNQGGNNARILAEILNQPAIRLALQKHGIRIPENTYFLAALHNTTTDEVFLFDQNVPFSIHNKLHSLKHDLSAVQKMNSASRCSTMGFKISDRDAHKKTISRSQDWAQVLPEWGLARNASFIVGPRTMTQNINLEGRSFLHSYDWKQDNDGLSLTTILTAPMIVAQWINAQYLFSTLDNVAFGGGNKITKNIVGKMGIMQGNSSDLMHGLPLQSVYENNRKPFHEIMRLTVVVYSPSKHIDNIINNQEILRKLFSNGWLYLICIDPASKQQMLLKRDLTWTKVY